MQRAAFLASSEQRRTPYDLLVIGGGANGAGIALDAARRGLEVVLLERGDFGCGTSSRSSKLIHGGIRYLALAQFGLVKEALYERALLLRNAAGLVKPLPFVIPAGSRAELYKFAAGLKLYDSLAGERRLARSRLLSANEARHLVPQLGLASLAGAVLYTDAQFDDARLLFAILQSAAGCGATLLNHMEVTALEKNARGRLRGVTAHDTVHDRSLHFEARVIVNASGVHGDALRRLAEPSLRAEVLPSQGAHVVIPRAFQTSDHALVLPRTPDGRLMFAMPWHGQVLLGTTDTVLGQLEDPPVPQAQEIDMILAVAGRFLTRTPRRSDVLSSFAGVRPLAATPGSGRSSKVSREHAITVDASGLVSVSGGKWTTYRRVAEQCVDVAAKSIGLHTNPCSTQELELQPEARQADGVDAVGFPLRGIAQLVAEQPALAAALHASLPYSGAHFAWAARAEMALNVADALCYHSRALFIDARAAAEITPRVAAIMAAELGQGAPWVARQIEHARAVAARYILTPIPVRETRG